MLGSCSDRWEEQCIDMNSLPFSTVQTITKCELLVDGGYS